MEYDKRDSGIIKQRRNSGLRISPKTILTIRNIVIYDCRQLSLSDKFIKERRK